jgi:dienelactone hydrolase
MLRHTSSAIGELYSSRHAWWRNVTVLFVSDTAVPYYGIPPAQLADVSTIRVPILGHFAEQDTHAGFSDPQVTNHPPAVCPVQTRNPVSFLFQAARDLTEKLKAANVDSQIIMHKGVGHGFVNPIHGAPQVRTACHHCACVVRASCVTF